MKFIRNTKAFTLLELILVVIVIGILATLAVPQFTDLAEKARAAEAVNTIGAIKTAEDLYKIETGGYTDTVANLSITFPVAPDVSTYWTYGLSGGGATGYAVTATRTSKKAPTTPPQGDTIIMTWLDGTGATWSGSHIGVPAN